ncbi:hypothetical protein CCHR01_12527 [Colletotrichum chrysophilum]|uniref:Zn(2)-C6 fungal-type domain-containing protein n=1 Tax=Colletotrichum chrysophilum TaxID=1836956 RepID=A0AAD9AB57_9PEZI|nr:hypothetical protein CCHR01_12527 [Colletotrichum chrysophilum]
MLLQCDERKPCGACVRQQISCSLAPSAIDGALPTTQGYSGSDLESRGFSLTLVFSGASGASLTTSSSLTADSAAETASERWSCWTADLGLMNHFTSVTSATLPGANLHTWRDKVPKVATDYPFLMHQILAVSAFHLATLEPQKRQENLSLGLQHQQHAIRGVYAEISNVTPQNCHALFAASSMLFIGSFTASSPALHSPLKLEMGHILEIFTLIRGVSGVLTSAKENVRYGILRDFMQCDRYSGGNKLLESLLRSVTGAVDKMDPDDVSPEVKSLVERAVSGLRDSVGLASATTPALNVAVSWPMVLSSGFMALLETQHPAALVVLVHYCTVLHEGGLYFWFMKDWGSHLMNTILRSLTSKWQELVDWPVKYINQGAPGSDKNVTKDDFGWVKPC